MGIPTAKAAAWLREHDNIVLLAHKNPDGDTYGSCFALLYALEEMGKNVRVECADGFLDRYRFLYGSYRPGTFDAGFAVAADVADLPLLGGLRERYEGKIDLCIDHHPSNSFYAKETLLDASAAATAQIVLDVLRELGTSVNRRIANCIFTGLATDTGCFMYDNVSAKTHQAAAEMIDAGAEHGFINKLMFDTKSRGRLEIDRLMMDNLEFYFEDRCALVYIPVSAWSGLGVTEEELDGVSSFPRKIEGVRAGVTIREREGGVFRVSLRTGDGVDASRICQEMGGGGHRSAAGCTLEGELSKVKARVLEAVGSEFSRRPA